ncbi:MAG TPA: GIY-YIG nuclease family protein [Thermoanaerobaculia bacterium]|nr:GIY-YIG nuclease family protein [Thermoanaerobaculia bacterium]
MASFFVYIMASRSRCLYVGVSNQLVRRVREHKEGRGAAFTSKYRVDRLVFSEGFADVRAAIQREKQIKDWRRSRKVELIESLNPEWDDLSRGL